MILWTYFFRNWVDNYIIEISVINIFFFYEGEPGDEGFVGLPGMTGLQGRKGEPGFDGRKGEQGDFGLQGEIGFDGRPGKIFSWYFSVSEKQSKLCLWIFMILRWTIFFFNISLYW